MNTVAVWFVIGMAVGLVSLILPHTRRASSSVLQVASAVVGGLVGGAIVRGSMHRSYGFGSAFVGAVLFALVFMLASPNLFRRRRAT